MFGLNQFKSLTRNLLSCFAAVAPEKIKRFNETFVYTRGHITIPEKPIEWKNEEE
jgi:hypothetical protein